jgi:hypothetical protein
MKTLAWKDIAESVGVIAIVASLLFVGLKLVARQIADRALGTKQPLIQPNRLGNGLGNDWRNW